MRIVRVSRSLVGKVVARTVYAADGRVLIGAGTTLTAPYVDGLTRRGYHYIAIEDQLLKDYESSDAISDITRVTATSTVQTTMNSTVRGEPIDSNLTTHAVEGILEDIQTNKNVVVSLSAVRNFDDYTFVHSVNVCVLSILLGQNLQYHRYNLVKLASGALLHDIGKIRIPTEIINKPGKLSAQEFELVKAHTTNGYDLLTKHLSYVSAHVALQHHERLDGSGYPRGLQDQEIHEFGRVAAVADVYDALTSDRPYRRALTPTQAIAEMTKNPNALDKQLIEAIRTRLAMYWEGSIVSMSDHRVGVVLKQTDQASQPVIRVISDTNGKFVEPTDVDLRNEPQLKITSLLDDYPEELRIAVEANYNHV